MHIGCFVYQYAKLRMLEFYYDFMDVFVDRRDFQYCAMDTASASMAIGDGNRRKPPTCHKSLTNFITYCCIEYISPCTGFELTTLVALADVNV
jgi:hypothetical protein